MTYFTSEPFAEPVRQLRCFRGISDLTALTVAAELGDPQRFPSAPRVMEFAGHRDCLLAAGECCRSEISAMLTEPEVAS